MKKKDGVKITVRKDSVGMSRPTSKSTAQSDVKMRVTSHTPDPVVRKSTVQGKEVASSRIDSARKANPALSKALGAPQKSRGGQDSYRDSKADLVNAALKRGK